MLVKIRVGNECQGCQNLGLGMSQSLTKFRVGNGVEVGKN